MIILNLQLQLFLLMSIGYIVSKAKIINKCTRKQLTDLVILIVLPCNIINSFSSDISIDLLKKAALSFFLACLAQVFYSILNRYVYRNFEESKKVIMKYSTLCSNAGFIGLPIIGVLFGPTGLIYASIALIPQRIVMWSSGISLFTQTSKKEMFFTLIKHPCIIAVMIGLLKAIFQLEFPTFLNNTIISISDCTIAVSMIIIGTILSDVEIRSLFEKATFYFSFIRLLLIPFCILIVLKGLKIDPIVIGVTVMMSAMPAGSTTVMLAQKYEMNPIFASKIVFVSTILSILSISLFLSFI